mmetsp:Transcript_1993/g.5280  ORF Transcript_1993/g.5280 Transcript_1993/m.5280 type:complete len:285 (+) Transcript_1993:2232-3086(+)
MLCYTLLCCVLLCCAVAGQAAPLEIQLIMLCLLSTCAYASEESANEAVFGARTNRFYARVPLAQERTMRCTHSLLVACDCVRVRLHRSALGILRLVSRRFGLRPYFISTAQQLCSFLKEQKKGERERETIRTTTETRTTHRHAYAHTHALCFQAHEMSAASTTRLQASSARGKARGQKCIKGARCVVQSAARGSFSSARARRVFAGESVGNGGRASCWRGGDERCEGEHGPADDCAEREGGRARGGCEGCRLGGGAQRGGRAGPPGRSAERYAGWGNPERGAQR